MYKAAFIILLTCLMPIPLIGANFIEVIAPGGVAISHPIDLDFYVLLENDHIVTTARLGFHFYATGEAVIDGITQIEIIGKANGLSWQIFYDSIGIPDTIIFVGISIPGQYEGMSALPLSPIIDMHMQIDN